MYPFQSQRKGLINLVSDARRPIRHQNGRNATAYHMLFVTVREY